MMKGAKPKMMKKPVGGDVEKTEKRKDSERAEKLAKSNPFVKAKKR